MNNCCREDNMEIIKGTMNELKDIVRLALMLWPNDYNEEQFNVHFKKLLNNEDAVIFLAKEQNEYVGFAHCQLRYDYVEGTETTPVGYLEGIYVMEEHRKKGIGKALVDYCENWSREKGCVEFASDTELENVDSLKFHLKVGFKEASRLICFTKKL